MCGIFGFIDFNGEIGNKNEIFYELAKFSKRRGKDSTGVWLMNDYLEHSCVLPINSKKFIKTNEFKKEILPYISNSSLVLGHCRLATNGEANVFKNNQPFINNGLVMAHNGIIVNTDDLTKEFKIKKYKSDSRVLMKIILKLIKEKKLSLVESIKYLSKYTLGTLNLVILDNRDSRNIKIVFASNNGSLYIGKYKSAILFASEKIFLDKLGLREMIINKIDPGKIVEIDAFNKWNETILNKPINLEIKKDKKTNDYCLTNHKIDFEKIFKIKRCLKCILPETTPFISFDDNGICNYCNEHTKIKHKGVFELEKIIKNYRSIDNKPDCIIAFSGGRDSSYGLHYLVKVLKMHPVAVTFDWGMLSDIGRRNQSRMLAKLGIEHIVVTADIKKAREDIKMNLKAWLKRPRLGMIPLLMQGDKTTEYYVDKIKKELGVKLVFFCRGNELEKEEFKSGYCGVKNADPGGVIHNYYWLDKLKLLTYYVKEFILNPAYLNRSLWSSFLGYLVTFVIPHDYIYLWHYVPWDENKIIKTLKEKYSWEGDIETGLTWRIDDGSPAFYNYIYCQIQGFTENDSFRSRQIREGIITRDKAIKLVMIENRPRYQSLKWYFDSIRINGNKVLSKIDKIKKRY